MNGDCTIAEFVGKIRTSGDPHGEMRTAITHYWNTAAASCSDEYDAGVQRAMIRDLDDLKGMESIGDLSGYISNWIFMRHYPLGFRVPPGWFIQAYSTFNDWQSGSSYPPIPYMYRVAQCGGVYLYPDAYADILGAETDDDRRRIIAYEIRQLCALSEFGDPDSAPALRSVLAWIVHRWFPVGGDCPGWYCAFVDASGRFDLQNIIGLVDYVED